MREAGKELPAYSRANIKGKGGAPRETRTPDPLITNQMLYQLSYKGSGVRLAQSSEV